MPDVECPAAANLPTRGGSPGSYSDSVILILLKRERGLQKAGTVAAFGKLTFRTR
jgi:hypothetical protein